MNTVGCKPLEVKIDFTSCWQTRDQTPPKKYLMLNWHSTTLLLLRFFPSLLGNQVFTLKKKKKKILISILPQKFNIMIKAFAKLP